MAHVELPGSWNPAEAAHEITQTAIRATIEELKNLRAAIDDRIEWLEGKLAGKGVIELERKVKY